MRDCHSKAVIRGIVPNIGKETPTLIDFRNTVVVAVSDTGGVAYDAAFTAGGKVLTATVARTYASKGLEPARKGVHRAIDCAQRFHFPGISMVAASSNSWEDVLAAQYLVQLSYSELRN